MGFLHEMRTHTHKMANVLFLMFIVDYLGNEWGSVILQTNLKYKKTAHIADQDGRYVLPSLPPIEVNSQWRKEQAAVSISQEVDVSVHDMHSAAAGKIHVADIEYIDVIIRMCTESGRKFKVLSIACC